MLRITQGGIGEDLFQGTNIQTRGLGWLWIVAFTFLFGVVVLSSGESWLLRYFVPTAYTAILYSFVRSLHTWRDPFNPLCLVLAVGFVRFFLPGILLLSGAEPPDGAGDLFQLMKLSDSDWQWGHALALVGMLAVVFGWLLIQARWTPEKPLKFHLTGGVKYASLAGMLVGFMALCAFFLMNASLDALESGEFRSTTIQEGTGQFFFVAYLLIVGSVLLCCYLLRKGFTWLALVPVGISMLSYWPLGGRGRAMMSVAGGLILLWYWRRERRGWGKLSFKPVHLLTVPASVVFIISVFYVGAYYRGNPVGRAVSEGLSIAGLGGYLKSGIYTDLGQLHSLAGAIAIGPAVLGGQSFIGSLSWPLTKFLPIPGRSAGVYLVETLVGFVGDNRWGLNSSLIGDAYLNFGLRGVVAVMVLYGALLKILYLKFRQGVMHSVIYTLAILSGVQMLWVSIEVWPQSLTMLSFAIALIWLGKTFLNVQTTRASTGSFSRIQPEILTEGLVESKR